MADINFIELATPFHADDIEWRIGSSGNSNGKVWARCFAYVTNRSVQQRLDDVCGPANWRVEFKEYNGGKENHGALCGISIKCGEEWVTKWDGANSTDVEPIKGGLSDAMKRAAVQWGIGRYLYQLKEGFATITNNKKDNWGKTKDGTSFNWIPPQLPAWALPGEGGGEVKPGDSHPSHGASDEMDEMPDDDHPRDGGGNSNPKSAPPPAKGSEEEKKAFKTEMDKIAAKYNLDVAKVEYGVSVEPFQDFMDVGVGAWINKLPRRDLQNKAIGYFLFIHYSMRVVATGAYTAPLNELIDEVSSDNRLNEDQQKALVAKIEKAKDIPF